MTHSPLTCFWRRWFSPLFISNSYAQGKIPLAKNLKTEEVEFLLAYIYEPHNLDDFNDWVRQSCSTQRCRYPRLVHAANLWAERFNDGDGELICSPSPGIVAWIFVAAIPVIVIAVAVGAVYVFGLGLLQLF